MAAAAKSAAEEGGEAAAAAGAAARRLGAAHSASACGWRLAAGGARARKRRRRLCNPLSRSPNERLLCTRQLARAREQLDTSRAGLANIGAAASLLSRLSRARCKASEQRRRVF